MNIATLAAATTETALNTLLKQDPETLAKLTQLSNKIIQIEFVDLGFSIFLIPHNQGIQVFGHYEAEPDTTLSGTLPQFIQLGLNQQDKSALYKGEIKISGNLELGSQLQKIFSQLEIDWEEILSKYTGDIIAHQAGNLFKQLHSWGLETIHTLQLDTKEYLQEEQAFLVYDFELQPFLQQVDALRADTDRIEAKIKLIASKIEQLQEQK